jgi:hypothetical protein
MMENETENAADERVNHKNGIEDDVWDKEARLALKVLRHFKVTFDSRA